METEQINIVSTIIQAISTIFSNLLSSIDSSIYSVLDDLIFIDTSIIESSSFSNLLGERTGVNMVTLCNCLVFGFILYYAISLLFSHLTFSKVSHPSQFIFKLFLCVVFINSSYFFSRQIIYAFSYFSLSIRSIGEHVFNTPICFSNLITTLNSLFYSNSVSFNIFSLDGILKTFVSFSLLNLLLTYALRYVMLQVFLLISPFAFLSLTLDNTSWIFKSWIKIILSLLFLQILIPIILLVCFSFSSFSSEDILSKIIYIGSIFALTKANTFIRDFMGGLSSDINIGISSLKSFISGGNS